MTLADTPMEMFSDIWTYHNGPALTLGILVLGIALVRMIRGVVRRVRRWTRA